MVRRLGIGVWLLALTFSFSADASATSLSFTTEDLGGGIFQYNLVLENANGPEPISGLNILHAFTVFGLGPASVIMAPQNIGGNPAADWSFFAPLPPLVDELNFFSLNPAADIPIGGSLEGFRFQSMTNPLTISFIQYDVIGGLSGTQIPEPATILLLGTGLMCVAAKARRRRKARSH